MKNTFKKATLIEISHWKLELPDSSCVGNREGGFMVVVIFDDVVCWVDEVMVEDVFFFAKIRNSDMIFFYKRAKNQS